MLRWLRIAGLSAALASTALVAPPSANGTATVTAPTARALPSDFNGDGVEDLAIGASGETPPDTIYVSGGVHIRYGADADGSRPPGDWFHPRSAGIGKLLRQYPSLMGATIVTGDFNRDGFADLVARVPGYDEPDPDLQRYNVGGMVAIYGSASGLDPLGTRPAQVWSQDSPGVMGVSEDGDDFGSSLASGDFDGDGYADVAVGAMGEMTTGYARTGSVTVLYGSRSGLTGRDQIVNQDSVGIVDRSERNDEAATALAAGDFDGDGVSDLAMGVSGEDLSTAVNAGAVNVIYGTRGVGLTGNGDRFVSQALASVPGEPGRNDHFGDVLAVGDFNGDDLDDLAIGAPEETVNGMSRAGSVTTLLGRSYGLSMATSRTMTLPDTPDATPSGANFGGALAAGDVDGDGNDELAVGSPGHSSRDGRVDVFHGGSEGPTTVVQTLLPNASDTVPVGAKVPGIVYGASLQFGEFDTTPGADLVVGAPRADVRYQGQVVSEAGAVSLVPSRAWVLDQAESAWLHQGQPTIGGFPEEWDVLGRALPGSAWPL